MRLNVLLFIAALLACVGLSGNASAEELDSDLKKLSYVLGMDIGNSLKQGNVEVDMETLQRAIADTMNDKELLLSAEQAQEIKQAYFQKMQAQRAEEAKVLGAKNQEEGTAFLAENKDKEGVITTESGLQYQVVKEGEGPKPKADDQVTVNYKGSLLDGSEFDSSYERGQPATFPVDGVIPGWTEALQLMPVGSTYRLFIPPDLAYGERGAGDKIGPNAVLVFEVELLEIAEPPQQ